MKRPNYVLVFVSLLMLITASDVTAKQQKTDICHITGAHEFDEGVVLSIGHVINISNAALQSHIDHGDLQEWDINTLPNGLEVCTATAPVTTSDSSEPDPETTQDSCYQAEGGKMIFLTSGTMPIDMSGMEDLIGDIADPLDRADALCNYYAQEASLCGTYDAWISINNAPAPLPFIPSFPLVRTDNELVAESYDDLLDRLTTYATDPICVDEMGNEINDTSVTPRLVWKAMDNYGLPVASGMTACCKKDDPVFSAFQCSRVGYAINAMGLEAYIDKDPFNQIKFWECAFTEFSSDNVSVRMYCIQQ